MRLAIVGLGLIGGSIARAVRQRAPDGEPWTIAAWSPTGRGPSKAMAAGVIDRTAPHLDEATADADLVVIAAPPLACLDLLELVADRDLVSIDPSATVTDVASTKGAIVDRAARLGLSFVGGHPMAGSERSGFEAASADLFVGRPWIVTPPPGVNEATIERVERLARICGAEPIRMDAHAHDRAVAAVSHLPLLLSAALVETAAGAPDWPVAARLAASGWRDMTRLARGDPDMGAGIAATNAGELAARIRDLQAILDRWAADMGGEPPDVTRLRADLRAARDTLTSDRSDGG